MAEEKVKKEQVSISLSDIVELADKFIKGEISQEEMATYGSNMIIRGYVPIMEKMSLAMSILSQHIYSTTEIQEIKVAELYRNIFFYGLLGGYAFIDCSDRNLITYENYDKLYPIFAPFILSYCKEDYEILKEFIHDSIDMYGLNSYVELMGNISPESLSEATKSNKELINSLKENEDLIHELNNIGNMNDPLTHKVVEELKNIAIKNAKKDSE